LSRFHLEFDSPFRDFVSGEDELDELDEKILDILKSDSRISFVTVAKKVQLSEGAVRKRINKMLKNGVIKRFTIEVAPRKGIKAITLVSAAPSSSVPSLAEKIRSITSVETVFEVSGQFDIAAVLSGTSIDLVNRSIDEIRRLEGVSNTNTLIVLQEWS